MTASEEELAVALDILADGCAEDRTVAWSLEILQAVSPAPYFHAWDGTVRPIFSCRVKSYSSSYWGPLSSSDSSRGSGREEPESKIPQHAWSRSGAWRQYGVSRSTTYQRTLWWENG